MSAAVMLTACLSTPPPVPPADDARSAMESVTISTAPEPDLPHGTGMVRRFVLVSALFALLMVLVILGGEEEVPVVPF